MKKTFYKPLTALIILTCAVVLLAGCYEQADSHINLDSDVRSNSLGSNVITKPISDLVNILIGKGIVITEVKTAHNSSGFLMVQVSGVNESVKKSLFQHRTEWLDGNGFLLDTVTDNWMPVSVSPKSKFTFKVVAPSREAVDYRINTRVDKNTK